MVSENGSFEFCKSNLWMEEVNKENWFEEEKMAVPCFAF